jgi:Potential Queuosine, Q, salvage protein family
MSVPIGPPRHHEVRPACAWVAEVATHVHLDAAALDALAESLLAAPDPPPWGAPHLVAGDADAETVAGWTLLLSALNFSFWQDEPRWRVADADGYMALAQALRRAYDAGVPLAQPAHWTRWSVADLAEVLRGDAGGAALPPMLAERHAVAAELGAWLVAAHSGSALLALHDASGAYGLAQTLAATLRGFRDVAEYRGRRVPLLKRAQIAAHDCGAALGALAPAGLRDRSGLTAFADYKLPQVLRGCGALVYAPSLAATVDARVELESGGEEEVEIRALTVMAVDLLVARLRAAGREVDAPLVDGMLWWRGQQLRAQPYHRVRAIWY